MAETLLTGEEIRAKGYNPDTQSSIGGKFYLSQFEGGGVAGGGETSQADTISRAMEMHKEAIQPAVSTYQERIPEIQERTETRQAQLEAERTPLTDRYNNLISQITQTGQRAEEQQTRVTSGEMGKRGLVGSSTLAQQELINALTPITEKYLGMSTEAGLDRESALRDLTNQITNLGLSGTQEEGAILNAIAQLQAGAGTAGIQTGISQYGTQQNLLAQQRAEDWQKKVYGETTLPESQEAIRKSQLPPTTSGAGGITIQDLKDLLTPGGVTTDQNKPEMPSTDQISRLQENPNVLFRSPDGQWAWDSGSNDWAKIVD